MKTILKSFGAACALLAAIFLLSGAAIDDAARFFVATGGTNNAQVTPTGLIPPGTNTFAQIQLLGPQAWNTNMTGGTSGYVSNMNFGVTNNAVFFGSTGAIQVIPAGWYEIYYGASFAESAGSALLRLDVFTNVIGGAPTSIFGGVHRDVTSTAIGNYGSPGKRRYLPAGTIVQLVQTYITGSGGGIFTNATLSVAGQF